MERQSNSITPRILMPKKAFVKKADELIKKQMFEKGTSLMVDVIQDVIDELAEFFNVSKISAKLRLIETGYDIAMSAYVYSDGKYVLPHDFRKGALKRNQTYTLSAQDAAINIRINKEIHDAFIAGSNFPQAAFHGRPCFRRCKNRDIKPSGKDACSFDMVHMLVGDEQCVDIIARQFQFCQTFLDLLAADARIDEDLRMFRTDICTVAAAPAGDGAEFQLQDDHLFS